MKAIYRTQIWIAAPKADRRHIALPSADSNDIDFTITWRGCNVEKSTALELPSSYPGMCTSVLHYRFSRCEQMHVFFFFLNESEIVVNKRFNFEKSFQWSLKFSIDYVAEVLLYLLQQDLSRYRRLLINFRHNSWQWLTPKSASEMLSAMTLNIIAIIKTT